MNSSFELWHLILHQPVHHDMLSTQTFLFNAVCKQPSQWSQSICTQFIRLFEGVLWNQTDLSRLCSGLAKAKLMRAADKKV